MHSASASAAAAAADADVPAADADAADALPAGRQDGPGPRLTAALQEVKGHKRELQSDDEC